ncbi:MAG: hypothetical protein IT304_02415 [Dehalococcoidia bacterium]|nr:hypothetical protein [Dehalococcoidia bacterium]
MSRVMRGLVAAAALSLTLFGALFASAQRTEAAANVGACQPWAVTAYGANQFNFGGSGSGRVYSFSAGWGSATWSFAGNGTPGGMNGNLAVKIKWDNLAYGTTTMTVSCIDEVDAGPWGGELEFMGTVNNWPGMGGSTAAWIEMYWSNGTPSDYISFAIRGFQAGPNVCTDYTATDYMSGTTGSHVVTPINGGFRVDPSDCDYPA